MHCGFRRCSRIPRLTLLLLGAILCAPFGPLTTPVRAQPADGRPPSEFGSRFDGFQYLFETIGAPVGPSEQLRLEDRDHWSQWIVVVLGDPAPLETIGIEWSDFVDAGGCLLIASEEDVKRPLAHFGLGIVAADVEVPPREGYLGIRRCPVIRDFKPDSPLFDGVDSVVLNDAGIVRVDRLDMILAWLPRSAQVGDRRFFLRPAVMAGGEIGNGKLLVVADQSVFINEMLLESNLNNFRFARNAVEWMVQGRDPRTLNVLVFANGEEVTHWLDPRFVSGQWPVGPKIDVLGLVNELINGLEDEHAKTNLFNDLINNAQSRLSRDILRQLTLIVPSCILGLLVAWWLLRGRSKGALEPAMLEELPRGLVGLDQRRREVLEKGNFAEPTRYLAEQFFAEMLGSVDWRLAPPPFSVSGDFWSRWSLRRRVLRAWRIATSQPSEWWKLRPRWSRRRFFRTQQEVAELRSMVKQGTIVFSLE